MGCDYYRLPDGEMAHFSEMDLEDGGCSCLCTFPHNNKTMAGGVLDKYEVESLALLGAAVVLSQRGYFADLKYVFIPHSLPSWVFENIKKVCDTENRMENNDLGL